MINDKKEASIHVPHLACQFLSDGYSQLTLTLTFNVDLSLLRIFINIIDRIYFYYYIQ